MLALKRAVLAALVLALPAAAHAQDRPVLVIPTEAGPERHITTDDLARIRDIDTLSLAPDGRRFAILVRQARPGTNDYVKAWFAGAIEGGALTYLGDAGEVRQLTRAQGFTAGEIGGGVARWSPDGRLLAFIVPRGGQAQIWVARTDGRGQARQVTNNASDVRDVRWSADSRTILFSVGSSRADLAARLDARARAGFRLQEFRSLYVAVNPSFPETPLETDLTIWRVGADGRGERLANEAERAAFARDPNRGAHLGAELDADRYTAAVRPPVRNSEGAAAWLERADPDAPGLFVLARLRAELPGGEIVICEDPRCEGQIFLDIWWAGEEVVFRRAEGDTDTNQGLHVWSPRNGSVRTLADGPYFMTTACDVMGRYLVCLRETPLEPRHVSVHDISTGAMRIAANVNPEFAAFRLGRVEQIEWEVPQQYAEYGYAPHARGFILYPPDYDPAHAYPVFIAPYWAGGFLRGDFGDEHPLLVYAANGFIVLNSGFPPPFRRAYGPNEAAMRVLYDQSANYPHLRALSDTTLLGLDLAARRASIDLTRVGTGGVSHGAFIPFYISLWHDRLTALSVAGGSWGQLEYYYDRLPEPGDAPLGRFPEDPAYWAPIDASLHLDQLEAPVLFHVPDREMAQIVPTVRRMADAGFPFEAYVFANEFHAKSQPAHRLSIYNRNLDWFRFWLQDIENPSAQDREQYERWRRLRELQCRNPRSLRDFCSVQSEVAPPQQ